MTRIPSSPQALGLAAALCLCQAPTTAQPIPTYTYDVTVDGDQGSAQVRLCADAGLAGLIAPEEDYCLPYVPLARLERADGSVSTIQPGPRGFDLPQDAGRCMTLTVDVARAVSMEGRGRTAQRSGKSVVVSPDLLLWHPAPWPEGAQVTAAFHMAEGQAASVPWPPAQGGGYSVPLNTWRRQTRLALGEVKQAKIEVGGATLNVGLMDGYGGMDLHLVTEWLRSAAEAVSALTGSFPRDPVQIIVQPVRSFEPVPFGKSIRGGGAALQIFANVEADLPSLKADWVAVHEMAHLVHPFIDFKDAWFSEGIATYYQEVALARGGLKGEEAAWQALADGFSRGAAQVHGRKTLTQVASELKHNMRFMQVYWSGAAFALRADVALRSRGDGWSLDRGMRALKACCGGDERPLRSKEVADRIDQAAGGTAIRALHDAIAEGRGFPELSETWATLGIVPGDALRFVDDAPGAEMRRAIMSRPAPAAEGR